MEERLFHARFASSRRRSTFVALAIAALVTLAVTSLPSPAAADGGRDTGAGTAAADFTLGENTFEIAIDDTMDGSDYLYQLNAGVPQLVATYPLGYLESSGDRTGPASGNPSSSNMTRTQVHCIENTNAYAEGYHCLHIYKPSQPDGSSTYNYRYAWWTGSDHAKCCNDLNEVRNSVWFPSDAPAAQEVIAWKPNGTAQPTSCNSVTLTLNASRGGVGLSVGSTFTRCQSWYGPHSVGPRNFSFKWTGEKDNATWIGMGGGLEFRYPQGQGWKLRASTYHKWCTPDWACQ